MEPRQTVCELVGRSERKPEDSTTSRVEVAPLVMCEGCRVGLDALQAAGDILEKEGRWVLDGRPAEFRSVYAFVEYLGEEERRAFTLGEVQELAEYTGRPFRELMTELARMGYRQERPASAATVRGIGRLKPAPRAR